jgi:hypothetical protein
VSCTSRTLFPRPMRRGEGPKRRTSSIATSRESKATPPRDVRTGARSAPRPARAAPKRRAHVLTESSLRPGRGSCAKTNEHLRWAQSGFRCSTETKAIGLADSGGAGQGGRFALWVLDATSWPPPRVTSRRRPNPSGSLPPSPPNQIPRARCARRCLPTALGRVRRATATRAPGTPGSPIGHRR